MCGKRVVIKLVGFDAISFIRVYFYILPVVWLVGYFSEVLYVGSEESFRLVNWVMGEDEIKVLSSNFVL